MTLPMMSRDKEFLEIVKRLRPMGFGRMMQIISDLWYQDDPKGAFTVGECYGVEELKRERCKKEGHDMRKGTNWNWCDRCGVMIDPDTGKEAQDC